MSHDEPATLTAQEIAELIGVTKSAVAKRAAREGWAYAGKPAAGGVVNHYILAALPPDIQALYYKQAPQGLSAESSARNLLFSPAPGKTIPQPGAGAFLSGQRSMVRSNLSARQNEIAGARYDLCTAYLREKGTAKRRKSTRKGQGALIGKTIAEFCEAYNAGVVLDQVRQIIGPVAPKTLEKWTAALVKSGYDMAVLAPRQGLHRKGLRTCSEHEMQSMLKFALHPNRLRISQVIRFAKRDLEARGIPSPSAEITLRRALMEWRDLNYDKWIYAREGEKALVDHVLPYIERDSDKLAVGECLVADGHTLNFQVVNPFTGRPGRATLVMWYDWASRMPAGWNIMFTESTQNIHAALRRAILALGKLPQVVYLDNGRAFKARIFTHTEIDFEQSGIRGLYARLGIDTHFAWPYNARSKPVERFFGTMNELERLLPSYTGQSIPDKPAWMNRNEKLHRRLHNSWVPTIDEAHEAIRRWVYEEYSVRRHSGIQNRRPIDVWNEGKGRGVDEEQLRFLMMSMAEKTVRRNGIRFPGVNFYDEALYGYRQPVLVRYDMEDMEKIYVYNQDGTEFICMARPIRSTHPLASRSGNPLDMETLKQGLALQRRLKKQTQAGYRAAADMIEAIPAIVDTRTDPAAIELRPAPRTPGITKEEGEQIEAQAAATKVIPLHKEKTLFLSIGEAYEHHLLARTRGEELTADQIQLMEEYEASAEYGMLRSYYEQLVKSLTCDAPYVKEDRA